MTEAHHLVWIELEVPVVVLKGRRAPKSARDGNIIQTEEGKRAWMVERAKLASDMLRRCGAEGEDRIFVRDDKGLPRYCRSFGGGSYEVLNDNGAWFDLTYLGRPA